MEGGLIFETIDKCLEDKNVLKVLEIADEGNAEKIGLYLQQASNYFPSEEAASVLDASFQVYMQCNKLSLALRIALHQNSSDNIARVFDVASSDRLLLKQLALMLMRQRVKLPEAYADDEELVTLSSGAILSERFAYLAKELDVVAPKAPQEVFKTHLEERRGGAKLESAKENLASTYVNAFVNAGFCSDKDMMLTPEADWVNKNKDHGKTAATASLGMLLLWNNEAALTEVDRFQYAEDVNTKAGAILAFGLATANVTSDIDSAFALLVDQLEAPEAAVRIAALTGLGVAFAGTGREEILELVVPLVVDSTLDLELSAHAALCLGLVYAGTANDQAAEVITQALMERSAIDAKQLDEVSARYFGVALGLVFLKKKDACEVSVELCGAIEHPIAKYVATTVETCAYACSGDVLKAQTLLHKLSEAAIEKAAEDAKEEEEEQTTEQKAKEAEAASKQTAEEKKKKEEEASKKKGTPGTALETEDRLLHQGAATLGLPLLALGDALNSEMCGRLIDRLLQYGETPIKRAVPFALALNYLSNPKPSVVDALSRLTHDTDADVALHAILSLGLVAAGTNNARVGGLLRQLAGYYSRDANALYTIRLAQGLVYMGKGLLSLGAVHSDGLLVSTPALASLVLVMHAGLSFRDTIMLKHHYLLFALANAISPKWLVLVDEDLNPLPVNVRVGQAVDTVGQVGVPRAITGFQTHNAPVLINPGERAELADEEYIPLTPVLEGIVILRKNPNFVPEETK